MNQRFCATSTLLLFATLAYADGRNYTDGPVVNVSAIKTVDGHFDDYMQWLATTWKKQEETAKKAGLITKYQVLVAQPQGPFDGLGGKLDAVSAQVEGSSVWPRRLHSFFISCPPN
jgi:hypothetical protein